MRRNNGNGSSGHRDSRYNRRNDHGGRNGGKGRGGGVGQEPTERESFITAFNSEASAPRAHGRNGTSEHQAVDRGEKPPAKKLTDFYNEDTGTFSDS